MLFLKKASINDINGIRNDNCFISPETNILEHYKEFELFLTKDSLNTYCNKTEELKKRLEMYNASIKAVHCPESLFITL